MSGCVDGTTGEGPTVALVSVEANDQLVQLARALARGGYRPLVVTRDDGHRRIDPGVRHHAVVAGPARPAASWEAAGYFGEFTSGLVDVVAATRPDVVHTVGQLAGLGARSLGPGVCRVHSFRRPSGSQLRPGGFGSDLQRVERAAIGSARRVLAESATTREVACRLGVPLRRIAVVPPGVDLDVFRPTGPTMERRAAAQRLVLVADDPQRFPLRAVLRAVPDSEIVLLDLSGGSASGATAVPIAREHWSGHRVQVVDAADPARRASVLRSADLLLCRDAPEDARTVPMEAMACGVPVVACCPESEEMVEPGITGIHAYQEPHLVHVLSRLLRNPVARQAMSSGAVDRAASRFGWARVAAESGRHYAAVLDPGGDPGRRPGPATQARRRRLGSDMIASGSSLRSASNRAT